MAYYKDIREYLSTIEAAGKLRRVKRLINKDTELHPLVKWQFRGLDESQRTGFLFEKLTDIKGKPYNCAVATSIIGPSREVYAIGMKCETGEIHDKWVKAYERPYDPKLVKSGPLKEEIHIGNTLLQHGGLNEFAIPIATNGWEPLPRFTAVSWHTKDPDTGITNIGTYNGMLIGPLHTSCRVHRGHLEIHWEKCRQKGIPLQAAAVVGAVPAISMVSVTKVPYEISELSIAGGIAGEPIEIVKCETVDIEVPATAEIVIEGEIPIDHLEPDPASGEHTGYTIIGDYVHPFHVKCITHRKNPIWHDYISQLPPSESSTIRGIGAEGRMISHLKRGCGIPQIKDCAFHHCAGAYRMCVIRFQDIAGERTPNEVVWQAMLGALSVSQEWPKVLIAVDDDIDPTDLESVFWAVSFRYQPHRDTKIIQGRNAGLDQSAAPADILGLEKRYPKSLTSPQGASSILMDATRKWEYTPTSLPKKHYMENAKKIWQELGFPELKPREPWYGVNLGLWPQEYQHQAELGEKGEFEKVAEIIKSKRRNV